MKEPDELDKLNAVAQAEASTRNLHSLRLNSVFILAVTGLAVLHVGSQLQNLAVRGLAVLVVAVTVSVYVGWRYAPAIEEVLWPLTYGAFVLSAAGLNSWIRMLFLFLFVAGTLHGLRDAIRIASAIRLAGHPSCAPERETIRQWVSQLTSTSAFPGIIQFAAEDFWKNGQVTGRLLQQTNWIVVATLLKKDPTKILTLDILDKTSTPILFSPDQHRLRIGKRKFRKVEFTTESAASAHQIARVVATV
jgi:hypothetical protein